MTRVCQRCRCPQSRMDTSVPESRGHACTAIPITPVCHHHGPHRDPHVPAPTDGSCVRVVPATPWPCHIPAEPHPTVPSANPGPAALPVPAVPGGKGRKEKGREGGCGECRIVAGLESQIITSISYNGRVINTGLAAPSPLRLLRLIQPGRAELKGMMDNSLNSHKAPVKSGVSPRRLRLCP